MAFVSQHDCIALFEELFFRVYILNADFVNKNSLLFAIAIESSISWIDICFFKENKIFALLTSNK
jgi:hypothetical protein